MYKKSHNFKWKIIAGYTRVYRVLYVEISAWYYWIRHPVIHIYPVNYTYHLFDVKIQSSPFIRTATHIVQFPFQWFVLVKRPGAYNNKRNLNKNKTRFCISMGPSVCVAGRQDLTCDQIIYISINYRNMTTSFMLKNYR